MAVITYFKAVDSETDGTQGAQVTSGEVDAILPYLTSQQRIAGLTQLEKFYIESDVNLDVFIGFTSLGQFTASMIDSSGTAEVASAITGANARFGASNIIANSATGCTIAHHPTIDMFRAGDFILVGDVVVQIDTITANTTDRVIVYLFEIPYVNLVGTNASAVLQKSLVADVGTPLWVENVVPAGAPATQTYNTLPLVLVS